jgi:aryl-alcohol dehydrogenase-like predicted oxidoreductase
LGIGIWEFIRGYHLSVRSRRFPRLDWQVSEIGYGMWGMGGWTGADDAESARALDRAVALGCNFFDTAFAYGEGHSERLLGDLVRRHPERRLYLATKIPPKNRTWPGRASNAADDVFPYDHIIEHTRASLKNLGTDAIDLQQLHVWDDSWTPAGGWRRAVEELKQRGVIRAFGISVNRWQPHNVLRALGTGLVDSVQVVYNIFDQSPEDELFPACRRLGIAVIARVPFDEGSLTGTLTADSRWPEGDWRNIYFAPDHLRETLPRVENVRRVADAAGMTLPDLALRFILAHPAVTTTIPGMRRVAHVETNLASSDAPRLTAAVIEALRPHRWNRQPDNRP